MKRIFGFITIIFLSLCVAGGVYCYKKSQQPKNIFDEMYREVEDTYETNNILRKIPDFDISATWSNDNDLEKFRPYGEYEVDSLPPTISKIEIQCSFVKEAPRLEMYFDKIINKSLKIHILMTYEKKTNTVEKSIVIIKGQGDYRDTFIRNDKDIKSYLSQYHITTKDLDTYYNQVVNQRILKDWCSIYDSKFSPDDYGKVKIKCQWENW